MEPQIIRHDSVTGEVEVVNQANKLDPAKSMNRGLFNLPAEIRTQ